MAVKAPFVAITLERKQNFIAHDEVCIKTVVEHISHLEPDLVYHLKVHCKAVVNKKELVEPPSSIVSISMKMITFLITIYHTEAQDAVKVEN